MILSILCLMIHFSISKIVNNMLNRLKLANLREKPIKKNNLKQILTSRENQKCVNSYLLKGLELRRNLLKKINVLSYTPSVIIKERPLTCVTTTTIWTFLMR